MKARCRFILCIKSNPQLETLTHYALQKWIEVIFSFYTEAPGKAYNLGKMMIIPVMISGCAEFRIWSLSTWLNSWVGCPENPLRLVVPEPDNKFDALSLDVDVVIVGGGNA